MWAISLALTVASSVTASALARSFRCPGGDTSRPSSLGWERSLVALSILHGAGFAILFAWFPVTFIRAISEDQWVEWITFYCFLAASGLGVSSAVWWWRRDRLAACAGAALAALCLFAALEEISWGHRLIGFETPSALLARNSQGEANLHNLFMGPGKRGESLVVGASVAGIAMYACFLPAALRRPILARYLVRLPVPSLALVPLFLLAAAALVYVRRYRVAELGEYLLALGLALTLLEFRFRGTEATVRPRALACGLTAVFALALATAASGFGAADGRAWSRGFLQYYLHSFAMDRYPLDSLWNHSHEVLEYAASHGYDNQQTVLLLSQVARNRSEPRAASRYLERAASL